VSALSARRGIKRSADLQNEIRVELGTFPIVQVVQFDVDKYTCIAQENKLKACFLNESGTYTCTMEATRMVRNTGELNGTQWNPAECGRT